MEKSQNIGTKSAFTPLLYYSAVTLLATFLLGDSLTHSVQYFSCSAVLYSCYNICNSCSCRGHAICPAHDALARTSLYWDGSTCAQASLKCSPIQASPNSLTSDLRPQCSRRDRSPTTQKGPPHLPSSIISCNY